MKNFLDTAFDGLGLFGIALCFLIISPLLLPGYVIGKIAESIIDKYWK